MSGAIKRRKAGRGFTRIDLVALVAVVGILATILLPALAQDREQARDRGCELKLKQLAIALQNYHDVYKRFPATSNQGTAGGVASVWWPAPGAASPDGVAPSAGYTTDAGTTKATAGYSWIVRILPFIDEQPVYNSMSQASKKFTADAFTPYDVEGKAEGVGGQVFSIQLTRQGETISKHFAAIHLDECACPSYGRSAVVTPSAYEGTPGGDPPAAYGYPNGSGKLGNPPNIATITNYVALAATHFPLMQYSPWEKVAAGTTVPDNGEGPNGVIVPGSGLNLKAITDGAASTLMLCETIEPAMSSWYDGTTAWTTAINPNSIAKFPPSKADPAPDGSPNPNHFWCVPSGGTTALNVGPGKDKTVAYSPALAGYCATPQVISWGPSSNHPGGVVNHVAADGAIHPITDDIDPTLYMRLVTRAGREPATMPASVVAEVEPPAATEKPSAPSPPGREATLSVDPVPIRLVTTNSVEIWALAFSGNDKFLAASGGGGRDSLASGLVRVWDFDTRKQVAAYPTPRGDLTVTLSPDGRRVAWTSWSADCWMYEVGGPQVIHTRFGLPCRTALSSDGMLLVAGAEGTRLELWDAVSGKEVDGFRGETLPFFWLGFSPDGKYMVGCGGRPNFGSDVQAAVWDVASREQLYTLSDNPEQIQFAAISPDSKTLATSGGNSILLRDLATGAIRDRTEETKRPVQRIEFSPAGSLLASAGDDSNDGVVTLWDPSTGKAVGTLAGHARDVRAMAFTHDGKTLATGGGDRSIRLWDVTTRQQSGVLVEPAGPSDPKGEADEILAVAYSPDGDSVAMAGGDGQVSIYGVASASLVRSWMAHADAAAALAYSPDGQTLVSGGYDKAIKFWNPATGELIRSLSGHQGWVTSLAFSHDGQTLASGSYDRSIRLWNVADGAERLVMTGHQATVRAVAFSHNDKLLASGSADRTVRLWDTVSGQEQAKLAGHERGVRGVAFAPDDRLLASGGEDKAIKLWNVDSHELAGTLTGHTEMVSAVAFAHETLISASWDQTLRTWDVAARQAHGDVDTDTSVVALAVAPDGNRLLTAGTGQSLALWKTKVGDSQPMRAGPRRRRQNAQ